MKVKEIMTTRVVTVTGDTPVPVIAGLLRDNRISGVPVIDADGAVVGLVSEYDLLARSGETAGEVMTSSVITVSEDTDVDDVRHLLVAIGAAMMGLLPVVEIATIITVIGYSRAAVIALGVAPRLENDGDSAEVIDLRSLRPLDRQTVCASVRTASRAVIVEDDWLSYGIGAEITATIAEGAGVTPTVAARSVR